MPCCMLTYASDKTMWALYVHIFQPSTPGLDHQMFSWRLDGDDLRWPRHAWAVGNVGNQFAQAAASDYKALKSLGHYLCS